jgi:YcxB-like protein
MNLPINIKYCLTKSDILEFSKIVSTTKKTNKIVWLLLVLFFLFWIFTFIAPYIWQGFYLGDYTFIPIFLGVYILLKKAYYPFAIKSSVNTMYENPLNKNLLGNVEFTFSNLQLISKKEYFYSEIDWPFFLKVIENGNYFFIFINSMQAYIIPKQFCDYNQDDLRQLLQSKIEDYKIL